MLAQLSAVRRLLVVSAVACSVCAAQLQPFGKAGDVAIGALLPLHSGPGCSGITASRPTSLLFVEPLISQLRARNFRLEASSKGCRNGSDVSNSSDCVRVSFSLGYEFADTYLSSSKHAVNGLLSMLRATCPADGSDCPGSRLGDSTVAAVVGPLWNTPTFVAAPVASAYRTPMIGLLASSDRYRCDLNNEGTIKDTTCVQDFEYMFRMVASDIFGIIAIGRIIEALDVSYVGVVSYTDEFHRTARRSLLQLLNGDTFIDGISLKVNPNMCLAFRTEFSATDELRRLVDCRMAPTNCQELCDLYSGSPPSQSLRDVVDALNKNPRLLYIVLLAADADSSLLIDTRAYMACGCGAQPKADCDVPPRQVTIIGNEKWFLGIEARAGSRFYQRCAGLGNIMRPRPDYMPYLKQFGERLLESARAAIGDFIISPTPAFSQPDPYLCDDLEKLLSFKGVCNASVSCAERGSTCVDRQSVASSAGPQLGGFVRERYIFLASAALLTAMDNLMQRFVDSSEARAGQHSAADFRRYAYGPRLLQAVKQVQVCEDGTLFNGSACPTGSPTHFFKVNGNEVDASFHLSSFDKMRKEETLFSFGSFQNITGLLRSAMHDISWNNSLVSNNQTVEPPTGGCHPNCIPGEFKVQNRYTCCFECQQCTGNTITQMPNLQSCTECEEFEVANKNRSACVALTQQPYAPSFAYVLMALLSITTFVLLTTLVIMIKFFKTPIIQSSDKYLTFAILGMLIALSLSLIVFTSDPPTVSACRFRVLMSSLLTIISTTLFVKTSRLARISGGMSLRHSKFVRWTFSNAAQVVLVVVLSSIPFGLDLYSAFAEDHVVKKTITRTGSEPFLILWCRGNTATQGVQIGVDVFLSLIIIATAYVAFLTRKLPVSFNEARFLFLATLTNAMTCLPLSAAIYLVEEAALYIESMRVFSYILLTWLWLFVPRLYIVLLRPNRNRIKATYGADNSSMSQTLRTSTVAAMPGLLSPSSAPPSAPLSRRVSATPYESTQLKFTSEPTQNGNKALTVGAVSKAIGNGKPAVSSVKVNEGIHSVSSAGSEDQQ
eukprot:scpid27328/ scgid29451/ Metabotropic glutamate receptor 7